MSKNNNFITTDGWDSEEEGPSKSQVKREMLALQVLGGRLTELNAAQLKTIPLEDELREAIADHQRFKHKEAKRRQLQFIGKLMRKADAEAIEQALELTHAGSAASKNLLHKIEQWRDRLIEEGDGAVNELMETHPQSERQLMRQLIRDALKQRELNKPPAASRKLFQYLKEIIAAD